MVREGFEVVPPLYRPDITMPETLPCRRQVTEVAEGFWDIMLHTSMAVLPVLTVYLVLPIWTVGVPEIWLTAWVCRIGVAKVMIDSVNTDSGCVWNLIDSLSMENSRIGV